MNTKKWKAIIYFYFIFQKSVFVVKNQWIFNKFSLLQDIMQPNLKLTTISTIVLLEIIHMSYSTEESVSRKICCSINGTQIDTR